MDIDYRSNGPLKIDQIKGSKHFVIIHSLYMKIVVENIVGKDFHVLHSFIG